jgi:hypothetical protein
MKATKLIDQDFKELISILKLSNETNEHPDVSEIKTFFLENKETDYIEYLQKYNEKYGQIIKKGRDQKKLQCLSIIKNAALIQIITFLLVLILVTLYFIVNVFSQTSY